MTFSLCLKETPQRSHFFTAVLWRSFVSSCLVFWAMSYTQLSAGVRVESSVSLSLDPGSKRPGSIVPICKWTSARCHPQTARRQRRRRSKCPYVHMLVSSHKDLSLSIGFTTSWFKWGSEREGWGSAGEGMRRLLANLAALYFRLSFILPTDFLCISFRSLRAANMQKCCKRRLRKRKREREGKRRLRDREWEAEEASSGCTSMAHVSRAFRVINGINIPFWPGNLNISWSNTRSPLCLSLSWCLLAVIDYAA